MPLEASVIVPTFEDWPVLQKCLDCLAEQSVALDRFEVIIANNNSSPLVPDTVKLPQNARVIHATTPGSYAARNAALLEAQGKALFFTDSDCLPDPRWIETGLAAIADLGPCGRVAGGVELFPHGTHWTAPELFDRVHWLRQADYVAEGRCVTANMVVRKVAFAMIGPFSEASFSGGDGEWNRRAKSMGCELVYRPEALVRHPARPSFAELAMKQRRLTGRQHQAEVAGLKPPRSLGRYLTSFLLGERLRRVLEFPGLTRRQRFQVLLVGMRLSAVSMVEMARLRYFSAKPVRR